MPTNLTVKEMVLLGPHLSAFGALINKAVYENPEFEPVRIEIEKLGFKVTANLQLTYEIDRLEQKEVSLKVIDNIIQPGTFKGRDVKEAKKFGIDLRG